MSYVATKVANPATFCREEYSSMRVSSSVRMSDARRSEQNLGERSVSEVTGQKEQNHVLERLLLDERDVLEMLKEGQWRLGNNV